MVCFAHGQIEARPWTLKGRFDPIARAKDTVSSQLHRITPRSDLAHAATYTPQPKDVPGVLPDRVVDVCTDHALRRRQ